MEKSSLCMTIVCAIAAVMVLSEYISGSYIKSSVTECCVLGTVDWMDDVWNRRPIQNIPKLLP